MKKLASLKQSAKLRRSTDLRPVTRSDTPWSSTFAMYSRFIAINQFLDTADPEIAVFIPSQQFEIIIVNNIINALNDIESFRKQLPEETCDLSDVRILFGELLMQFPALSTHLAETAKIVKSEILNKAL